MGDFVPTDDTQQIVKHKDGSSRIEGATPVEDVERLLSTGKMPDDESYETMAGFLMYPESYILRTRQAFLKWSFQ